MSKCWLLKAEPDSRIVKGKDVKFSVDDFEAIKTTPWEGVRNHEACNLMKEMKVGEKAFFYHSNCANPGIAAFAEVSREAYPDHTAWDSAHPYFDPKTNQDAPKWSMIDLTFLARADHFVPLSLLKHISTLDTLPTEIAYIGEEGLKAIKLMDLVTRGRLSVQRVDPKAWDAITSLAKTGGWESLNTTAAKRTRTPKTNKPMNYKEASSDDEFGSQPSSPKPKSSTAGRSAKASTSKSTLKRKPKPRKKYNDAIDDEDDFLDADFSDSEFDEGDPDDGDYGKKNSRGKKRKASRKGDDDDDDYRSSARKKRSLRG